jgi:hypothetical protein
MMQYILIALVSLVFGMTTYCFVIDHIKRYWIIGFDGRVVVIRGPFDFGEYVDNELDKAHKDFQEYVVWRRSFANRDKIIRELGNMYHMSRIIRRISDDGYTLRDTTPVQCRDKSGKFTKRGE